MDNGESVSFSYIGGIQTFTVPNNGVYKLECSGGGNYNNSYDRSGTAYGGYVSGYKYLKKGTILYICVGGSAGYNGGGTGKGDHYDVWAYVDANNGSGATHIALKTGVLTDFLTSPSTSETEESFTSGDGFLIAGGAGGCQTHSIASGDTAARKGGDGGASGSGNNGKFGRGNNGPTGTHDHGGGGGSGYRGGYAASSSGSQVPSSGASGGSNWIGGVPEFTFKGETYSPTSTGGGGSGGNGSAKITLVKKSSSIKIGDKDMMVYIGNQEIFTIYIGNTEL